MKGQIAGGHRAAAAAIGMCAVLAACGSTTPTPAATVSPLESPPSTAHPTPTPTATAAPQPPLIVTVQYIGPTLDPFSAIKLTLISESGSATAPVSDPGGVDGDAYFIAANHVYFIEGTTVKAMARDGTVTNAGQVPQPATAVNGTDRSQFTKLVVSPDESTLLFGIPLAVVGDGTATRDHSQLWSEPEGGTSASATMVYDETGSAGGVLLPFAWTSGGVWGSDLNTSGLGGAGPFLDYSAFNPFTFDPASHVLTAIPESCTLADAGVVDAANNYACSPQSNAPVITVSVPSGTKTVTMAPADATGFGAYAVSNDGRYLAYGSFSGDFGLGTGSDQTTVVDLNSATTVATLPGYAPGCWLDDDRLVVAAAYLTGPAYLLSASFSNPVKISAEVAVGGLS
jgi:hypothetical protein